MANPRLGTASLADLGIGVAPATSVPTPKPDPVAAPKAAAPPPIVRNVPKPFTTAPKISFPWDIGYATAPPMSFTPAAYPELVGTTVFPVEILDILGRTLDSLFNEFPGMGRAAKLEQLMFCYFPTALWMSRVFNYTVTPHSFSFNRGTDLRTVMMKDGKPVIHNDYQLVPVLAAMIKTLNAAGLLVPVPLSLMNSLDDYMEGMPT